MPKKTEPNPDQALLDELQSMVYANSKTGKIVTVDVYSGTQFERRDSVCLTWSGPVDLRWALKKMLDKPKGEFDGRLQSDSSKTGE